MTAQTASADDGTELPRPRRGAAWRWARPRRAMVAGGTLAAVLGLGVATGAAAGAATTTSSGAGGAASGRPPGGGMGRPAVTGKITALRGDDITVETNATTSVTVVSTASTRFESNPRPTGGTTSSASALKVGDFIGVQGTKNSDGTVTATTVLIGRAPQRGKGGPGGEAGRSGKPPSGAPSA